jgi:hypothetical protein
MIPLFSSLWDRVGDRWLASKAACVLFALSSLAVTLMTVAFALELVRDSGPFSETLWGAAGVFAALSVFFLWSGMWRFWTKLDHSSSFARRCWFVVMLIGFWYGAILYFLFVYIPHVGRRSFAQDREVTS